MAKYIKQEAAVKAFENTKGHGFGFDLTDIKKIINSIPAADVATVVHGRWEHIKVHERETVLTFQYCECTVCGNISLDDSAQYCSNCGAKMDLEDK